MAPPPPCGAKRATTPNANENGHFRRGGVSSSLSARLPRRRLAIPRTRRLFVSRRLSATLSSPPPPPPPPRAPPLSVPKKFFARARRRLGRLALGADNLLRLAATRVRRAFRRRRLLLEDRRRLLFAASAAATSAPTLFLLLVASTRGGAPFPSPRLPIRVAASRATFSPPRRRRVDQRRSFCEVDGNARRRSRPEGLASERRRMWRRRRGCARASSSPSRSPSKSPSGSPRGRDRAWRRRSGRRAILARRRGRSPRRRTPREGHRCGASRRARGRRARAARAMARRCVFATRRVGFGVGTRDRAVVVDARAEEFPTAGGLLADVAGGCGAGAAARGGGAELAHHRLGLAKHLRGAGEARGGVRRVRERARARSRWRRRAACAAAYPPSTGSLGGAAPRAPVRPRRGRRRRRTPTRLSLAGARVCAPVAALARTRAREPARRQKVPRRRTRGVHPRRLRGGVPRRPGARPRALRARHFSNARLRHAGSKTRPRAHLRR